MTRVTIDWDEHENVEWQDFTPRKKDGTKRKLLITTDNFLPRWDGISRFLSEIVPRLQDSYEITVVCPDYGYVRLEGVTIERMPLSTKSYGDYTPAKYDQRRVARFVKEADVVFNQALGAIGISAILAAKRYRTPIVSYIHSVEWELFPKALATPLLRGPLVMLSKLAARFLYNRCTRLIVPSENIAEQFSWQRITTPKRIAHLGVDTKKFTPGGKKEARMKLGLPQDAFIVGYHGRIAYEKNLLTLLRGFGRLKVKNKKLIIVGDGVLELKSRIEQMKNVIVTGAQENVIPWLQAMDVYVQPSFTETTSLTVLEAMACGLPVISSKVGFIQYYLIHGKNGIFFNNASSYDLSRKLHHVYKDAALRKRLGTNARNTIEKSFQWRNTAENIKEVLDEV